MSGLRSRRALALSERGFTMVELLLALVLIALMTGFILGGLDLVRHTWRTDQDRQSYGEIDAAVAAIETQLSRAIPAVAATGNNTARPVFAGRAHDIVFVTLSEGNTQVAGMMLTGLALVDSGGLGSSTALDGNGRVRLWNAVFRTNIIFSGVPVNATSTVLFERVLSFDLAYFGASGSSHQRAWHDEWNQQDHLPELVAIKVTIATSRGPVTMDIHSRIHTAM
jgi:general secretion pathway protein J